MNLNSLFEGIPSDFILKRMKEYKENATELDLTLNMGKGFPGETAKGAWFGFAITAKGGNDERAKNADERLPLDIRIKGYLIRIAKLLEKEIADGNTVEITDGGNKKDRIKVEAGQVKDELLKRFKYGQAPGGAYSKFAGKKEGMAGAWLITMKDPNEA